MLSSENPLTPKFLMDLLKSKFKEYYTTPHLNTVLHLNYKGILKIENLDDFTGLRALYLNSNAIKKIEGLDTLE